MIRATEIRKAVIGGKAAPFNWLEDATLVRLHDDEDGATTYIPAALWDRWGPMQMACAEQMLQWVRDRG